MPNVQSVVWMRVEPGAQVGVEAGAVVMGAIVVVVVARVVGVCVCVGVGDGRVEAAAAAAAATRRGRMVVVILIIGLLAGLLGGMSDCWGRDCEGRLSL